VQDQIQILIIEDDRRLAGLMRDYLQQQGYSIAVVRRGDRAGEHILSEQPDLVILDLMLPGMDGLTVLKQVRQDYKGAVLILTAREDDMDQVVGLEIGADDYVHKPIEPRVLLARIRALLRRFIKSSKAGSMPVSDNWSPTIKLNDLVIDRHSHRVAIGSREIELTTGEFELLWLFASNAGIVLDRGTIFQVLRGFEYDGSDRSIDTLVSRLRKKIEDEHESSKRIKTIWGKGYLFIRNNICSETT
jgi:DNA-binding response OmpR family regulator